MGAMTITVMWWEESLFLELVPFSVVALSYLWGKVLKVPLGIFRGRDNKLGDLVSKFLCIQKCSFKIIERDGLC